MICSLFNFCPQSAQSRSHWGALVGLAPQNKAPSPPIWNMEHYKSVEFCQFIECQVHLLKNFQRRFWVRCLIIFCPQETQSYPDETRVQILTWAVAWSAQSFGWVKMFDFVWDPVSQSTKWLVLRKSFVVRQDFAAFSYIRSSYVSSTIDVARTVFTNLSLLDLPIKDF